MFLKLATLFSFTLIAATSASKAGSASDRPLPDSDDDSTKLTLTTDYLFERIAVTGNAREAHWISLSVTLDRGVRGKGTLVLDPNTQVHNDFGDPCGVTEIATHSVDITLEVVNLNDPARKGRRLYEIKGKGLKTGLFLVVSPPGAGPHRLIVGSTVLPLKEGDKWAS